MESRQKRGSGNYFCSRLIAFIFRRRVCKRPLQVWKGCASCLICLSWYLYEFQCYCHILLGCFKYTESLMSLTVQVIILYLHVILCSASDIQWLAYLGLIMSSRVRSSSVSNILFKVFSENLCLCQSLVVTLLTPSCLELWFRGTGSQTCLSLHVRRWRT